MTKLEILKQDIEERISILNEDRLIDFDKKNHLIRENKLFLMRIIELIQNN